MTAQAAADLPASAPQNTTSATRAIGATFSTRRFSDLPLHENMQRALQSVNFDHCTPIQDASLSIALNGKDLLGKAQTGTGKTAAFLITIFQRFLNRPIADGPPGQARALVVAPTRELALQIRKDALLLSRNCSIAVKLVIGGEDMEKQHRALASGPCDLLIATPGRLLDLQRRGVIRLHRVEVLVLDEADRLLDMGFLPDLRRIVSSCPPVKKRQTMMFSATFSALVVRLAKQWSNDLQEVSVAEKPAADSVQQIVYNARSRDRLPFLANILKQPDIRALIFVNRRMSVRTVHERLCRNPQLRCAMIAGDMPQHKRKSALERFRSGSLCALIATDVAGRGLHVEGVTHVINYDLPEDPEQYVHRIGRTGRIGASGISISFATEEQAFLIPEIEAFLGEPLKCEPLPQGNPQGNRQEHRTSRANSG